MTFDLDKIEAAAKMGWRRPPEPLDAVSPKSVLALVEVVRSASELANTAHETLLALGELHPASSLWEPLLTALDLFGEAT